MVKPLTGIQGAYEILVADGINMKSQTGNGTLDKLPPASVAFIRQ